MTLSELSAALAQAVATQKIGVPTALRMMLQLSRPGSDLAAWLGQLVDKFVAVLNDPPTRLLARSDPNGLQWHLLLTGERGTTASLVIGHGAVGQSSVQLILIGNHGVVRLSGRPELDEEPTHFSAQAVHWQSLVADSLAERRAVKIEAAPAGSTA